MAERTARAAGGASKQRRGSADAKAGLQAICKDISAGVHVHVTACLSGYGIIRVNSVGQAAGDVTLNFASSMDPPEPASGRSSMLGPVLVTRFLPPLHPLLLLLPRPLELPWRCGTPSLRWATACGGCGFCHFLGCWR